MKQLACFLLYLSIGCNHAALGEPAVDAGATDGNTPVYGLADVARLCVLAASCGAAMNAPRQLSASQCTATVIAGLPDDPVTTRFYSCAGATSCDALRTCLENDLLLLKTFSPNSDCDGTSI